MKTFLSFFLMAGEEALSHLELKKSKLLVSSLLLVIVNLIPILGVTFLSWEPRMVLLLYWAETGIIGVFNIMKMLYQGYSGGVGPFFLSLFLSLFFTVHYGAFMAGHGFFLFFILFTPIINRGSMPESEIDAILEKTISDLQVSNIWEFMNSEWFTLALLVVSHAVAFYLFVIKESKSDEGALGETMFAPYKRITLMHILIIFGALAVTLTQGDISLYIYLFIALKIVFDLRAHIKEKIH